MSISTKWKPPVRHLATASRPFMAVCQRTLRRFTKASSSLRLIMLSSTINTLMGGTVRGPSCTMLLPPLRLSSLALLLLPPFGMPLPLLRPREDFLARLPRMGDMGRGGEATDRAEPELLLPLVEPLSDTPFLPPSLSTPPPAPLSFWLRLSAMLLRPLPTFPGIGAAMGILRPLAICPFCPETPLLLGALIWEDEPSRPLPVPSSGTDDSCRWILGRSLCDRRDEPPGDGRCGRGGAWPVARMEMECGWFSGLLPALPPPPPPPALPPPAACIDAAETPLLAPPVGERLTPPLCVGWRWPGDGG
jgi:hypothetical protein